MSKIECVIQGLPDEFLRKVLDEEVQFPDVDGQKDERGISKDWYFITFKQVRILNAIPNGSYPIFEVWWVDHGDGRDQPESHEWFIDGDEGEMIDTDELVERLNHLKPFIAPEGLPYKMIFRVVK